MEIAGFHSHLSTTIFSHPKLVIFKNHSQFSVSVSISLSLCVSVLFSVSLSLPFSLLYMFFFPEAQKNEVPLLISSKPLSLHLENKAVSHCAWLTVF